MPEEKPKTQCDTHNCAACGQCSSHVTLLSKKQSYLILLIIIGVGLIFSYFSGNKNEVVDKVKDNRLSQEYFLMGTVLTCEVFANNSQNMIVAQKKVLDSMKLVEDSCNLFNSESELSRLNKTASIEPFKCSNLLWMILQKSRYAYAESNGSFDITAKPLMDLWGFYKKQNSLPSEAEIAEAVANIGLDKVVFDDKEQSVFFPNSNMSFDLGGIAKGMAIDLAIDSLKEVDIDGVLINLGGNIKAYGEVNNKASYLVGIRDPLKKDSIIDSIEITNQAVATSGNYERFVTINGKQYAHIMDTKTGLPVENMLSVTIVCDKGIDSDIYSTSVFINGVDFAKKLVEKYPEMQIYIFALDKDNNIQYIKIEK